MFEDLTPEQRVSMVKLLTPESVVMVYSGKPGCGCGCKGAYRSKGRMVTNNLKALQAAPDKVKLDEPFGDRACFALETEERFRWVYVPIAEARRLAGLAREITVTPEEVTAYTEMLRTL
jgi:hypothetical protein